MAGMVAFAVFGLYVRWIRPANGRLGQLHAQIAETRAALDDAQARLRNLPALRAEVYRLQAKLEPFGRRLPRQPELGVLLKDLGRASQRSAVRKFECQPGTPRSAGGMYEQPVTLSFEGDFFDVFSFLKQAEEMPRLTRLRSLSLKARDATLGQVEARLAMSVYSAEP